MGVRGPFWLRSVRRRPASFVTLAALAAIAMLVSVLAPTLFRAVEQVTLAEAVHDAGRDDTALVSQVSTTGGQIADGIASATAVVSTIGSTGLWTTPTLLTESNEPFTWSRTTDADRTRTTNVAVGEDACRQARSTRGKCPQAADEIAIPRSAASASGVSVGDTIGLVGSNPTLPPDRFTVVGVYDGSTGTGALIAGPGARFGAGGTPPPDLVVSRAGFDRLVVEGTTFGVRFLAHPPTLADVPVIRSDVRTAREATLTTESASSAARFSTGITDVLDHVGRQQDAAGVLLAVTAIQALGLAWFAEGLVIQRIGRVRATEWGLGRLRGLPRRRWLGSVFLEPAVALVLGAVAGAALGAGASALAATTVLGPSATVEPFRPLVLAAAGLSVAGSLIALLVSSIRSARLPLVALLRQTSEPRVLSRTAVVVQAGAVLVTVTVLGSLATEQEIAGPGVALLAPSLVAVLIGIVGLRVAVVVIRRRTRRPPRSLGGVLIGRQLARTPSVLSTAVMVTVGIAIAVYATQAASVGTRLQDDRAAASLGAATVLDVSVPADATLLDAVRSADPTGRQAMAAEVLTSGTGVGRLVAVDTDRLAVVSSWRTAWSGRSAAEVRNALAPRQRTPSFRLTGTELRLTLSDVGSASIDTDQSTVRLAMVVQTTTGWHRVDLGSPRDGTVTSDPRDFPCADGCRVVWLGIENGDQLQPSYSSAFTVRSIATDQEDATRTAGWLDPDRWRNRIGSAADAQIPTSATLGPATRGTGLQVQLQDGTGSGTASIAPRDAPEPAPALLGAATGTSPYPGVRDAVAGIGLDESSQVLRVVGRAPTLPRVFDDGALVDLGVMDRLTDAHASQAQREVWLAPGAHPRVLVALRAEGLRVTATRTLADAQHRAERAAPTLGAVLGLPIAAGGVGLTLLAVVAIRLIGAGARRREWASLRDAGVPDRSLRRVLTLDALLPTGAGALLGAVAGLAAFAVTIGRLPLLAGSGAAPPPDFVPAVLPLVVLVVGVLLLLAGVAVVGARLELGDRTSGADRSRASRPAPATAHRTGDRP
ncbi:FtsX-like permease family protein [Curtobacterium sp. RRHDQ10]|uniref:FtsX-like permease family protein n=1 Tax=Curtobacterium phyllosphaerae TaxID=3413379 RepID=UPI003BF25987